MTLSAQNLSVNESSVNHEDNSYACIVVQLAEPGPKKIKKAYRDWIEDTYDAKVDGFGFLKNNDVLVAEGAHITSISNHKMDLYSKIVDKNGITEFSIFGALGYDYHIEPATYPEEFAQMKSMVYAFLNEYLPGYYEEQVEDAADIVSDISKDQENAREDVEKNRDEIEELRKENAELSTQIKEYELKLTEAERQLVDTKKQKEKVSKTLKKKN